MKNLFFLLMLLMIISCSSNQGVYWCGDHPCINKKEKEAYFKKTMIVEMKSMKNKNYKDNSEIEKIMQHAKKKEKIRIKNEKDLTKQAKLKEKELAKQLRLEEKELAKQLKLEEKRRIKDKERTSKRKIKVTEEKQLKKKAELNEDVSNAEINLSKFRELVEKITKKNTFKPYPDIDDIPN